MAIIFLQEFIGMDYMNWTGVDEVFIQTPTGSGKTTFILEILSVYARQKGKEVLLLVNRKILKKQVRRKLLAEQGVENIIDEEWEEVNAFDGVTVLSYQELQQELKRKDYPLGTLYEERFQYVVMDEIHYILEDSVFNREISYLLKAIPKIQNKTVVYLSATLDEVFPFLLKTLHPNEKYLKEVQLEEGRRIYNFWKNRFVIGRIKTYCVKPCFQIEKIRYFQKLDEITDLINEDSSDEKWLIFVNSKQEARKLEKGIKCGRVSYLDADVDEEDEVKRQIVKTSKFRDKVLITTKVLDNGVNLRDRDLKNVVLLTTERTEFIQMLGRKRFIGENDSLKLFLASRDTKYFNAVRNRQLLPLLQYMNEIKQNIQFNQQRLDDESFYKFCQRMTIISNGKIEVSRAAEEKVRLQVKFYDAIIEKLKINPDAFVIEQLSWLGKDDDFSVKNYLGYHREVSNNQEVYEYMKSMVGKKLDKEKKLRFRKNLQEKLKKCGKKLSDRAEETAGKRKINNYLQDEGLPFLIKSVQNSQYWEIQEVKQSEANVLRNRG